MQFRDSQAIYLQIADYVCEKILLKEWMPEQRIPSVRELAMQLEVNPNTALRAMDFLQSLGILYNQRGIGYFVSSDAHQHALRYRRQEFTEKDMPVVFRNMYLLGMDLDELKPSFESFKKQQFNHNNARVNENEQ
ncbi:MAG TPA: GntR family transcriptional regulator [Chitinophagaceae bacterium]|nr:GntR family transcriptional regulator [Chitinophagaceae bacterium]